MRNLFSRLWQDARKHKRLNILLAVVIIILLGVWLFYPKKSSAQYQTTTVQRGNIISTVSESGNVSAGSTVDVSSPTTGIIEDIYVKNGDQVTAGENLFKVKAVATPQDQASAFATYENAVNSAKSADQSKLSLQASLEKDRQAILSAASDVATMNNNIGGSIANPATKQAYTQNDIDAINSAYTSAEETFSADEAKYNNADTAIAAANAQLTAATLAYQATQDAIVTAPVDGTVANLAVSSGSDVSASGNSSSGTSSSGSGTSSGSTGGSSGSSTSSSSPVLVIGNFNQLYIKTQVNEVDISKIKSGQKATITLDAFPDKTFVGTVTNIDTIGTSSSGVVTYNVYISFLYPPDGVIPGMTASATIQTDRKDNVLMIPSSAIQTNTNGSYVRVLQNGQITQVPVETGISDDTNTEITSGLSEGQTIVTSTAPTATSGSSGSSPFSGLGGRGGFGGGGFGGGFTGGARGGTVIRTGRGG